MKFYMARVTSLLLLGVSQIHSLYVPGTPGGSWTQDEVLAVKAKLRYSFAKKSTMTSKANTAMEEDSLLPRFSALRSMTASCTQMALVDVMDVSTGQVWEHYLMNLNKTSILMLSSLTTMV